MDYQKELILFLEHFAPNQSQDVRDAVELDASFHVINVPKLLAVKGLSENYVFRLKDSWNAWKAAKASVVPATVGDIQSWIAVNSFSALDAIHDNVPIVNANELAKYIDSLDLSVSVPEGFVLMPKEMHWHKADDLACLEWDKHKSLFCSQNRDLTAIQVEEFRLRWCRNKAHQIMSDYKAMIEAQELSTHQSPNIKYDTTYVIEVVGYTQIEDARNLLNQKGYKTWDFTDKENIDEFSTYIICACPTLSSEGVVLAKQTYASLDQSKFKYVLTKIEDFPLAREPSND